MNHICPCCNVKMVSRINPKGSGRFFGCPNFVSNQCKVSYSPTENKWYGLPHVQAQASARRGRCISHRELVIVQLMALKSFSRDEAVEYIDTLGLPEVQRLLAA